MGLRQAAVVRELEGLALEVRQLAERGLDAAPALSEVGLLGGLLGRDLLLLSEPAMRAVRGNEISMIFQEPMSTSIRR